MDDEGLPDRVPGCRTTGKSYRLSGVRFDLGKPVKPLVLNWGDELYVAEHYPDNAGDDELQETPIMPV